MQHTQYTHETVPVVERGPQE